MVSSYGCILLIMSILQNILHVKYGDFEAVIELENLSLIDGALPNKCGQLVREWATIHKDELMKMWETQSFHKIQPLE
jgi:hypothetical protein